MRITSASSFRFKRRRENGEEEETELTFTKKRKIQDSFLSPDEQIEPYPTPLPEQERNFEAELKQTKIPSPDSIFELPNAPTFYPTKEEFEDFNSFMKKIRPVAKQFGICKVVPPANSKWDLDVISKYISASDLRFQTKQQHIHQLQNRRGPNTVFLSLLRRFWSKEKDEELEIPVIQQNELDLFRLFLEVHKRGGPKEVDSQDDWIEIAPLLRIARIKRKTGAVLARHYYTILDPFVQKELQGGKVHYMTWLRDTLLPLTHGYNNDVILNAASYSEGKREESKVVEKEEVEEEEEGDGEAQFLLFSALSSLLHSSGAESETGGVNSDFNQLVELHQYHYQQRKLLKKLHEEQFQKVASSFLNSSKHNGMEAKVKDTEDEISNLLSHKKEKEGENETVAPRPPSKTRYDLRKRARRMTMKKTARGMTGGSSDCVPRPPPSSKDAAHWKMVKQRAFVNSSDAVEDIICYVCGSGDGGGTLLVCDGGCAQGAHFKCLDPPIHYLPRGDWYCANCTKKRSDESDLKDYGYEQGKRFNLDQFKRADISFKKRWFQLQDDEDIPLKELEQEYWNIVEKGEDNVVVFYGSDLDVFDHSSGFPLDPHSPDLHLRARARAANHSKHNNHRWMAKSGWNLNNMALHSFLKYLNQSIAGVTRPMLYVGMLFSTFCWHVEDNFLYSSNYVHVGAPKRWYGVPAYAATKFEDVMRRALPELFKEHENLLHLLITMLSPRILQANGVPVYTAVQKAGEFIFTFPRAYHAGFNQGFNVAESVNFALEDWVPYGRHSVKTYRFLRSSVFPHEEIIFKAAQKVDTLETAQVVLPELEYLLQQETEQLGRVLQDHRFNKVRLLPKKNTEVKQCDLCGYDCFFSNVFCLGCKKSFCLHHCREPCSCSEEGGTKRRKGANDLQRGIRRVYIWHSTKELEGIRDRLLRLIHNLKNKKEVIRPIEIF